ncbi:MAG: hypothetical protein ACP5VR_04815 [Acidimicrobiales bacterium]
MRARSLPWAVSVASAAVALSACGVSVAQGGENAATHPASGIFVSPTVGAGAVSGQAAPLPSFRLPPSTPPAKPPEGQVAAVRAIQAAVKGGCWQDAHAGNVYGAYDQHFWWQGNCGDTIGQVTVELYPTVAQATAQAHHKSPVPLLARYQGKAVLVDVYYNAPGSVVVALSALKGLVAVPGYGP